jgi:uncharacterized OB-fold protein
MTNDPYGKPLPVIDPLTKPFWDDARREQLSVQSCTSCGRLHVPPTPVCANCLGKDLIWKPMSGRGTLLSWSVFHRAYWPGFTADVPYNVCLVQLEEGPILVSNLVDAAEGDVAVGKAVRVIFDHVTEQVTLPKFILA